MKFVALIAIITAENEENIKKIAKQSGASGAMVIQAKGSGVEEKKSFFSLTFEGNHTILLYILEEKMSRSVLKAIKKDIEEEKNGGMAFTTPISHVVGLNQTTIKKFEEQIKNSEVF